MALMSCRYGRVRKTCYLADLTSGCLVRSCRDAQALAGCNSSAAMPSRGTYRYWLLPLKSRHLHAYMYAQKTGAERTVRAHNNVGGVGNRSDEN